MGWFSAVGGVQCYPTWRFVGRNQKSYKQSFYGICLYIRGLITPLMCTHELPK